MCYNQIGSFKNKEADANNTKKFRILEVTDLLEAGGKVVGLVHA
jgi:hypothetical protein